MPSEITVSKKSEYFMAIGKKGIHSFLMLGVIDNDGHPKLLARVGKTNYIDPASTIGKIAKNIGSGTVSLLADEGVTRRADFSEQIPYQAYSINYDQAKEFLALIAKIEEEQLKGDDTRKAIFRFNDAEEQEEEQENATDFENPDAYVLKRKAIESEEDTLNKRSIHCYVPRETEGSQEVTFQYEKIKNCQFVTKVKQMDELAKGAQRIQINNTCRTTALNVLRAILGFETDISERFYISPKYETTLTGGQPDKTSFYILPSPPTVVKERLSTPQFELLCKLYKRMEAIPLKNPNSAETRAKFNAIKATYNEIVGENHLSAGDLLKKIQEHEKTDKKDLFEKRSPNYFSKLFSLNSTTENLFKEIKKALQTETAESTAKIGAPPTLN